VLAGHALGVLEGTHLVGQPEPEPEHRDGLETMVLEDLARTVDLDHGRAVAEGLDVGAVLLGVGLGLGELLLDGRAGQDDRVDGGVTIIVTDDAGLAEGLVHRQGPEDDPAVHEGIHRVVLQYG